MDSINLHQRVHTERNDQDRNQCDFVHGLTHDCTNLQKPAGEIRFGDYLITRKDVCQILKISLSKLNYMINENDPRYDPDFPKPRRIGRSVRFSYYEIMEYKDNLIRQ